MKRVLVVGLLLCLSVLVGCGEDAIPLENIVFEEVVENDYFVVGQSEDGKLIARLADGGESLVHTELSVIDTESNEVVAYTVLSEEQIDEYTGRVMLEFSRDNKYGVFTTTDTGKDDFNLVEYGKNEVWVYDVEGEEFFLAREATYASPHVYEFTWGDDNELYFCEMDKISGQCRVLVFDIFLGSGEVIYEAGDMERIVDIEVLKDGKLLVSIDNLEDGVNSAVYTVDMSGSNIEKVMELEMNEDGRCPNGYFYDISWDRGAVLLSVDAGEWVLTTRDLYLLEFDNGKMNADMLSYDNKVNWGQFYDEDRVVLFYSYGSLSEGKGLQAYDVNSKEYVEYGKESLDGFVDNHTGYATYLQSGYSKSSYFLGDEVYILMNPLEKKYLRFGVVE